VLCGTVADQLFTANASYVKALTARSCTSTHTANFVHLLSTLLSKQAMTPGKFTYSKNSYTPCITYTTTELLHLVVGIRKLDVVILQFIYSSTHFVYYFAHSLFT